MNYKIESIPSMHGAEAASQPSVPERPSSYNWLSFFGEKLPLQYQKQPEKILGGKGASLSQMVQMELPVPDGFTIYTSTWQRVEENQGELPEPIWQEIVVALKQLEEKTGKNFARPDNPSPDNLLTVSLRSGAQTSMPGLMDTLLNVGLTDANIEAYKRQVGAQCALSSYINLIRMYSVAVYDINHKVFRDAEKTFRDGLKIPQDLPLAQMSENLLKRLKNAFKAVVEIETGHGFEQDPLEQLKNGVSAIFNSFNNEGAIEYRMAQGISHSIGTAVNIQQMVHGNRSENSGSAVVFSRNLQTGKAKVDGHYRSTAQGEEVVAGTHIAEPISNLDSQLLAQIEQYAQTLERHFGYPVDVEITWEDGKLYLLQVREAKMQAQALVNSITGLLEEGIIEDKSTAIDRISLNQILALQRKRFDQQKIEEAEVLLSGLPLHTGVGVGKAYFNVQKAQEAVARGEKVVLICNHFDPNNIELVTGLQKKDGEKGYLQAIVTEKGSPSSHMGLIMSSSTCPMPAVMGVGEIENIEEGQTISVDSYSGQIYRGELPVEQAPELPGKVRDFVYEWEKRFGKRNFWANFLFPTEQEQDHRRLREKFAGFLAESQRDWQSKKAIQVAFENMVFIKTPFLIPTHVVSAQNWQEARSIIEEIREKPEEERPGIWLRSGYQDDWLQSPYGSLDLARVEVDVFEQFWTNGESPVTHWGGMPSWQQVDDHKLSETLIPLDPHDKLLKDKEGGYRNKFVFTLKADEMGMAIDVHDHNIHMRSLGQVEADDIFRITASPNRERPNFLGEINFTFGDSHFDSDKVASLLSGTQSHDSSYAGLSRKINLISQGEDLQAVDKDTMIPVLKKLIEKGLITAQEYQLFIKDRSLQVAQYIKESVFNKWWEEYDLPHTMWALQQTSGASLMEFQGKLDKKDRWIRLYGTKGAEETQKVRSS